MARAEVQIEQLGVEKLAPATPHRVYVSDVALSHIVDGKLHVVDGDSLRYLGLIATGYAGQATLSPDRRELYVATTYYSRLSRGERADVVDVYDTETLSFKHEIPIPPRHAQALHYKNLIRATADGRFLLIQNATPATSVTVVDVKAKRTVAEIPTPGCWAVLPSQSMVARFSTLCGDGTFLTVTLDADGKLKSQKRSRRFFDPDKDPLFITAENIGDRYFFVSFQGVVHSANLGGEEAAPEEPWSLLDKQDARRGWRPGGYQVISVHEKSGRLYVAMHPKGKEGSHKNPAAEIWTYDLAMKKRLDRSPGKNAVALSVSQDDAPLLFALDGEKMGLVVFEAGNKLRYRRRLDPLAETAFLMETH
ncbi:MAG: amine dehydrogenase [Rhodocyclales bacterium]|nr:amine dehydrogenase [Rhodocyclales bacterium]